MQIQVWGEPEGLLLSCWHNAHLFNEPLPAHWEENGGQDRRLSPALMVAEPGVAVLVGEGFLHNEYQL